MKQHREMLQRGAYDQVFLRLYGKDEAVVQTQRYMSLLDTFGETYGDNGEVRFFSAPGRTEIAGNHTDHQHGYVLASSVQMDVVAAARPTADGCIRIKSEGYPEIVADLTQLSPVDGEAGTSEALVRGVAAGMKDRGYAVGGFAACMVSTVLKGSGLSSSAAFEVLVGVILNGLYNAGRIDAVTLAQVGQYGENVFFGKPCGLMDQMASAVGGMIAIDFADPKNPVVTKVPAPLEEMGYSICVTDTGGSHADLTDEYAAIPEECGQVAAQFGKTVLREVDEQAFFSSLGKLREKVSERALLRSIHMFAENRRVMEMVEAMKKRRMADFLAHHRQCGQSSQTQLQNAFPLCRPGEQGINLGLSISQRVLGDAGSSRVHGGGFAGTIQAIVPHELRETYVSAMESVFGEGRCHVLYLRPVGGIEVRPGFVE